MTAKRSPSAISLALLEGYKVRWNRETVARDVVQNFFDEVKDFDEVSIDVDQKARTVKVSGPSRFKMDYLRYLGATTKEDSSRRSAGGFGEGFKICALVLLRDFRVSVTAGSSDWEIKPFFREMKLGRELCYEVKRLPKKSSYPGSFVLLEKVDRALLNAFASARDFFRHPKNPRLQKPIYVDEAKGIGVYQAHDSHRGDLFYRRQHRGYLRFSQGTGLTFAYDDRVSLLDADRDRRHLKAAQPLLRVLLKELPDEVIQDLIRRLRRYWQKGNGVLSALVREAQARKLTLSFPRRWLARGKSGYYLERHALKIGYHLGTAQLAQIGMPSALEKLGEKTTPRAPTPLEAARINIAREIYQRFLKRPPLFAHTSVIDIHDRTKTTDYRGVRCVIPARFLAGSFADGIADCLFALAVGVGKRSHSNGDRLTDILRGMIRENDALADYAKRWEEAAQQDLPPAEQEPEEADPSDDDDLDFVFIFAVIMAPDGFPPAAAIKEKIEELARAHKFHPMLKLVSVNNPLRAFERYARGVPSVWIGATEIEPPTQKRPSFAPRLFSTEEGPSIIPSEAALLPALLKEAEHARRRARSWSRRSDPRIGPPQALREKYYLEHLAKHDPPEYQQALLRKALHVLHEETQETFPKDWGFTPKYLIKDLAHHAIKKIPPDPLLQESLAARVGALYQEAKEAVSVFLKNLKKEISHATSDPEVAKSVLEKLLDIGHKGTGKGASLREITAKAQALLPHLVALYSLKNGVSLDSSCLSSCVSSAIEVFVKAQEQRGPQDAFTQAKEAFERGVLHALARHEQTDAEGDPIECSGLSTSLRELLGLPPIAYQNPASPVEEVVRKTWEEARAAGLSELEATQRCLDVAQKLSSEEKDPG